MWVSSYDILTLFLLLHRRWFLLSVALFSVEQVLDDVFEVKLDKQASTRPDSDSRVVHEIKPSARR
jgi:hypothetical protein